jgi:hypothetical protein
LFNQFDAVGIDFQRFCSLAHEERIQRYAKYLCRPVLFWRATIAEERFVTRGKANGTLALAHALKAAAFLEFTSNRGANIYSDDVLQVREAVQIIGALETMLFYDEVPPIRAGA